MRRQVDTVRRALAAGAAHAYGGVPHEFAAANTLMSFDLERQQSLASPNNPGLPLVRRDSRAPFFPELAVTSKPWAGGYAPGTVDLVPGTNADITWWNATSPDSYELFDWSEFGCTETPPPEDWTRTLAHFWDPDIGGAIGMVGGPFREVDMR